MERRAISAISAMIPVAAIVTVTFFLACISTAPSSPPWRSPGVGPVWPEPPDPPRIAYVGAIRSADDLGAPRGVWNRIKTLLFGREHTSMVKPMAVARSRSGVLVVTDPAIPTVHFFDLERGSYARLDDSIEARLHTPVGVAIDDGGRTFVADSVRRRVFVLDSDRRLIDELGEGVLERPAGLSLSPEQDRLYVADAVACRVFTFDLSGGRPRSFGNRGLGPGEFNAPTHVAVAPDGTLAVSDALNFRVQQLRPDGQPITSFGRAGNGGGDFSRPKGIAADSAGRIYVVDAAFENVQIFSPEGRLLLAFGGPGTGPGEFYLPTDVFLDQSDTIWVTDSFNGRVQVFRLVGHPG